MHDNQKSYDRPTWGSQRAFVLLLSVTVVCLIGLGSAVWAAGKKGGAIPSREAFSAALEKLNESYSDSIDPEANSIVGWYFCFADDDWETGIPYLALGTDDDLRAVARLDLQLQTQPKRGQEMLRMGNRWGKFRLDMVAASQKNRVKLAFQSRKNYWYEQALPHLSDEKKSAVLKSLGRPVPKSGKVVQGGQKKNPNPQPGGRPGGIAPPPVGNGGGGFGGGFNQPASITILDQIAVEPLPVELPEKITTAKLLEANVLRNQRYATRALEVYDLFLQSDAISAEEKEAAKIRRPHWEDYAKRNYRRCGTKWLVPADYKKVVKESNLLVEEAVEALETGAMRIASKKISEAAVANPDDIRANFLKGLVGAFGQAKPRDAANAFLKCARKRPALSLSNSVERHNRVASLNNAALALVRLGVYSKALGRWREIVDLGEPPIEVVQNIHRFNRLTKTIYKKKMQPHAMRLEQLVLNLKSFKGLGQGDPQVGWLYMRLFVEPEMPLSDESSEGSSEDEVALVDPEIVKALATRDLALYGDTWSFEDRRCMACAGSKQIRCTNSKCKNGVIKVKKRGVVSTDRLTGRKTYGTITEKHRCRTCNGSGGVTCIYCSGGVDRSL